MKVLLDENLSPKLARSLEDLFPGSTHVEDCGLGTADCATAEIEGLLRRSKSAIDALANSTQTTLVIFRESPK